MAMYEEWYYTSETFVYSKRGQSPTSFWRGILLSNADNLGKVSEGIEFNRCTLRWLDAVLSYVEDHNIDPEKLVNIYFKKNEIYCICCYCDHDIQNVSRSLSNRI